MSVLGPFLVVFQQLHDYLSQKTEVRTVILRCSTVLKPNWSKRYGTKYAHKNCTKEKKNIKQIISFLQKRKKKLETEIFAFCVITHEPIRI